MTGKDAGSCGSSNIWKAQVPQPQMFVAMGSVGERFPLWPALNQPPAERKRCLAPLFCTVAQAQPDPSKHFLGEGQACFALQLSLEGHWGQGPPLA